MDFSSAFNTVNLDTLCNRLPDLQVNPSLILWIKDFLQDQPQHVVVTSFRSKNRFLNMGVPQSCVILPDAMDQGELSGALKPKTCVVGEGKRLPLNLSLNPYG